MCLVMFTGEIELTKELINGRMNFLGYGNLKLDIWFIGLEEAGDEKYFKVRSERTKN